jgi:lipid-binding SYLF domain-containing protein
MERAGVVLQIGPTQVRRTNDNVKCIIGPTDAGSAPAVVFVGKLHRSDKSMNKILRKFSAVLLLVGLVGTASAATYKEALQTFHSAIESNGFFANAYGYAIFPNVGSGAVGIGGAYGKGRVYVGGHWVGYANMKQISLGPQIGGKSYSEIVFFEDKRSFDEFTSGKFEFGADASVTAITAGANADAGTDGVSRGSSEGPRDASTKGRYNSGFAVFVVQKGGLMAGASIAGEKFTYESKEEHAKSSEAE